VKKTAIWVLVSLSVILSVVLASCSKTTTPTSTTTTQIKTTATASTTKTTASTTKTTASTSAPAATTKVSTTTAAAQANWWDKFGTPQYGGTLNWRYTAIQPTWDTNTFVGGEWQWFRDSFTFLDWTMDRSICDFKGYTPTEYLKGTVLESWEQTDPQTYTFRIRKGITWQNKAPVNGREFTTEDVLFHFDRMMGTGHGFTTPNPVYKGQMATWDKITVVDKYTFTLKLKTPSFLGFRNFLTGGNFEASEWVAQGDLQNWKNAVGTGPWMLTDYIEGSSITYSANPNYWWHDERYPNNKIPYLDSIKVIIIPDIATAEASLRSGKIDLLGGEAQGGLNYDQVNTLTKTNPDLVVSKMPKNSNALVLRVDKTPFDNIKVRIALQMAINLNSIAKDYFHGEVDGISGGMIHPSLTGYAYGYADWPQSLKDEYSYNPTKAKALLAEAGYPDGFKTDAVGPANNDINLLQVIKANFADIGVDMEISTMDFGAFSSMGTSGKINQMAYWYSSNANTSYTDYISTSTQNFGKVNDTNYDQIGDKIANAKNLDEFKTNLNAADKYFLEQHWLVTVCPTVISAVWQPYLKGYSGEELHGTYSPVFARSWVTK